MTRDTRETIEAAHDCVREGIKALTENYAETTESWRVLIWLLECEQDLSIALGDA